ncbi:UNVERIFIED_CONTAM: hypothetical protein Sangu_0198200 [Sesamum angustifolium]|uniref:Uncharacterized protein n=1 Tax=Sesamum angustifolium TaxID=2727405 RepID=A0AAW2RMN6_9LAMI
MHWILKYELLREYEEVFQEPSSLPPKRSIEHHIELLPDAIPKKQHPYRYAYGQKTKIERIVKEMLQSGIIKPSQSCFASPALLVRRKMEAGDFVLTTSTSINLQSSTTFPFL